MATKIRLQRMGRKKRPFYRIVVSDSRAPRDGRFIESIGHYDPLIEPVDLKIDEEKALKWLDTGAIPSDTVKNLFRSRGIILKHDLLKKGAPENKISEELQKHKLLVEEKNKRKVLLQEMKEKTAKKAAESEEKKEEKPEEKPAEDKSEETQEPKAEEPQEVKSENTENAGEEKSEADEQKAEENQE
ncbi:30S ribosomal protein S16 [bacterium]|nr:30S ribosomal protein S16 [bacterium]